MLSASEAERDKIHYHFPYCIKQNVPPITRKAKG